MKRTQTVWLWVAVALMAIPIVMVFGSESTASENDHEPEWMTQARKQLKAYPPAEEGMVRYVLFLEPKQDESRFQVELAAGKVIETDGVNTYRFGGSIKQEVVKGWGYTKHVVAAGAFDNVMSTRIGVPPGQPKVKKFVAVGGGPEMVRYNSKLPIVVYVPAGGEVRYRVWEAPPQMTAVAPG
jgi:ecotin